MLSTKLRSRLIMVIAFCAPGAWGQEIVEWSDGNSPTAPVLNVHYSKNDVLGTITILDGAGRDFHFFAKDANGVEGNGNIDRITIDPNATGDFTILIDHPDANKPGARSWHAGDLRHPNPPDKCTITGINLSGDLVTPFGTTPRDIFCDEVVGPITAASIGVTATSREFIAASVTGGWHAFAAGVSMDS